MKHLFNDTCLTTARYYYPIIVKNNLILLLDHNTSWCKHMMEKHVLSDQTDFLSLVRLSNDLITDKNYLQASSVLHVL